MGSDALCPSCAELHRPLAQHSIFKELSTEIDLPVA